MKKSAKPLDRAEATQIDNPKEKQLKNVLAGAAIGVALLALGSGAQADSKQCVPIGGTALGQFFNDGNDVIGSMDGTWNATSGTVTSQKETATGLVLGMEHVFTTSEGGVVRTRDEVELTAVPGKKDTYMLELAYTVVESFGPLKGYTGTFNSFGLLKMDSGEALVRYSGEICK
jgi:hypothetical protein